MDKRFAFKREEAKRAGIIPITRERYLIDQRRKKYACAPIAAAAVTPSTSRWTIHVFMELDDDDDDEQIEMGFIVKLF